MFEFITKLFEIYCFYKIQAGSEANDVWVWVGERQFADAKALVDKTDFGGLRVTVKVVPARVFGPGEWS